MELYANKLPVSKCHQLVVKEALISEATPAYVVRSKTGYSGNGNDSKPGVAWWVGWIERDTEQYFFAFNMDIDSESKLPSRISVSTRILQKEGAFSSE